jgi:hypothetical protein
MLEMDFGLPNVARVAQVTAAVALGKAPFYACTRAVGLLEVVQLLFPSCLLYGFVLRLGPQL